MKLLSLDLGIPVMMCHQLNRAMVGRSTQTPILSDLRESGDVEQDADVVIFVHRPGLMDESGTEPRDYANIIVAKNRQGPVGRVTMRFSEITTMFHDSTPTHRNRA
jgi:replicative DNA helicase